MVGRILGQYRICEKLGEGGMGVVWKARDIRLERFVALKTLPAERLASKERKHRFLNEARAASALNHPNIVHIYEISEADGIPFISMEFVSGRTLDRLIGRKGLRLQEALKYGVQIADALGKAHAAGIVHRDLKPSNIIVDENGNARVLDFGIAKLLEVPSESSQETATMAASKELITENGAVIGTAAYMSPEQADGRSIDSRSDIFSFGSLVYEMLTGAQAFRGDSMLSTLSAILRDEPRPLSSLEADIPKDLEKIIGRCLRKNPDRRFQHMSDLKVALEDVEIDRQSGQVTTGGTTNGRSQNRIRWLLGGLAIVVLGMGVFFLRPLPHAPPRIVPLTTYPGVETTPAFSPDAHQVAFAWNGGTGDNFDIYVQLVDAGTPLRLTTSPASEYWPTWSPDGRYIAFLRDAGDRYEIWTVPALGGSERRLGQSQAKISWSVNGLSWSPDGTFIAFIDDIDGQKPSVVLMDVASGEKRRVTSPPNGFTRDLRPTYSPNGKSIAFIRARSDLTRDLMLQPLTNSGETSGGPQRLTFEEDQIRSADWAADGRSIIYTAGQDDSLKLLTVAINGRETERLGFAGENPFMISVSRSGKQLAYSHNIFDYNIWRVPGPDSSVTDKSPIRLIASTRVDIEPQFSPDGRKIAFSSSRSGTKQLWICDQDGQNAIQLTSSKRAEVRSPRWSPDSRWIAYDSPEYGNSDIFIVSSDGGKSRRLTTGPFSYVRPSWSRDGRWIYFGSNQSGHSQIWKESSSGGKAIQITRNGGEEAFESPDGKFLYYSERGKKGIWRVSVEGGSEQRVISSSSEDLFALYEKGICFIDNRNSSGPALKLYRFDTGTVAMLREFSKDAKIGSLDTSISVSSDGRWVLYTQLEESGSELTLVQDYR
jgi:Tol biopolymer transport system component/tRNA A-37 threonylcarbamoyl transferase component Bud32